MKHSWTTLRSDTFATRIFREIKKLQNFCISRTWTFASRPKKDFSQPFTFANGQINHFFVCVPNLKLFGLIERISEDQLSQSSHERILSEFSFLPPQFFAYFECNPRFTLPVFMHYKVDNFLTGVTSNAMASK